MLQPAKGPWHGGTFDVLSAVGTVSSASVDEVHETARLVSHVTRHMRGQRGSWEQRGVCLRS